MAVAGLSAITGSSGIQTFTFDIALAAQSGVSVTVENNVITITRPGLTQTIVTSGNLSVVNGIISGTVKAVTIKTSPSFAGLSCGTVSGSIDSSLATIPENAVITTTLSETMSTDPRSAFQLAAQNDNRQVDAIAYVMTLETTNFVATGPAVVTMTIPSSWVTSHGGPESVTIARWGDDKSTVEMLDTSYKGMNAQGDMAFEGKSPHGLSVFGLVQVTTLQPVPQEQQPGTACRALQVRAVFGKVSAAAGGLAARMMSNYAVIILVCAGLITGCILVYIEWYNRRHAQKKRD